MSVCYVISLYYFRKQGHFSFPIPCPTSTFIVNAVQLHLTRYITQGVPLLKDLKYKEFTFMCQNVFMI